jgi:N-acetylmuramoyl-L-alanine amidase
MSVTPTRNAMALRVRVLDQARLPAPDSVRIRVRVKRPSLLAPRDTVIIAREGVAWAYFHYPRPVDLIGGIAARVSLQPSFDFGDAEVSDDREPQSPTVIDTLLDPSDVDHGRSGFALQMPAGERLRDAPGTAGAYPAVQWINRDGFCALPPDSEGGMHAPQLPGFRTWGADTLFPPRYTAIAGGALWGKRIVLDPEGGGDDAAGIGRTGTRAATINLDVARALAAMLRAAGAEVALTREGDAAISEVERVQIAEGFRAERYLRIGHAAAPTVIGHYFSSAGGRRWGQSLAEMAVTLGLDSVRVADVAKYTLTQVSAVALYASLARIDDAAAEARLLEPGAARREAYALYAALLREFAADAKWTVQTFEARDDAGAPQGGAPVRLGGALVVAADAKGRVRYLATEQGPLQATFTLPGAAARVLLLDSPDARKTSFSR